MTTVTRRRFLQSSLSAGLLASASWTRGAASDSGLKIAPFQLDVTPPVGHPLCGGWIKPVVDVVDELQAIGFVLLGAGAPIVICAVDWTGISNSAHVAWREAIAAAAGTTADRVAVQCVHQHDAPFVSLYAEQLIEAEHDDLHCVDLAFFHHCVERAAAVVKTALPKARPITHLAHGEGRVDKVAGNRRVAIGPDGRIMKMRGSSCVDADLIALPEGLIDPMLKTVAFYDGHEKVLSCHYYATHPMSHYGGGHVSSDFVGLARKQRQKEEPGCTHIYFTGCAGNIAAGKYNNGTTEARLALTQRIYDGMVASEKDLDPVPIGVPTWRTHEILPPVNPVWVPEKLRTNLANKKNVAANRIRPAMVLDWIQRVESHTPIILSALEFKDVTMMHLPAECFVEYQLRGQQLRPGKFLATAAYGDGGPWYIPVKEAYPQGGYEVSVANCSDAVDEILTKGMQALFG